MKKYKLHLKYFIPPILYVIYSYITVLLFKKNNYNNYYFSPLGKYISPIFNSFSGINHEDLLIDYLLSFKKNGFYIDIGANDPNFPGNTKRFYLKGWRGINVEPQKKPYLNLLKYRPNDINLNIAVDVKSGTSALYELPNRNDGSSLNPIMAKLTSIWNKNSKIIKTTARTISLAELFKRYVKNKTVDFVSIDTEGTELAILQSNNWVKHRPKLLIIEIVHFDRDEIINFLKKKRYVLIYTNETNGIFIEKSFKNNITNNNNSRRDL